MYGVETSPALFAAVAVLFCAVVAAWSLLVPAYGRTNPWAAPKHWGPALGELCHACSACSVNSITFGAISLHRVTVNNGHNDSAGEIAGAPRWQVSGACTTRVGGAKQSSLPTYPGEPACSASPRPKASPATCHPTSPAGSTKTAQLQRPFPLTKTELLLGTQHPVRDSAAPGLLPGTQHPVRDHTAELAVTAWPAKLDEPLSRLNPSHIQSNSPIGVLKARVARPQTAPTPLSDNATHI